MPEDKKQQPRLVDVNEKALAEATDKAWRSLDQGAANRGGWLRAILLLARAFGAYRLLWRWMAPSVPIAKFVSICGTFRTNFAIERTLASL